VSLKVRAKILDITYDKENNIFKLSLLDLDKNKQTQIAIKGNDWGITPNVPDEIIKEFCEDMKGKEKNLYIEVDNSSIKSIKNIKKEDKEEAIKKEIDNLNEYPINEVFNILRKESEENED